MIDNKLMKYDLHDVLNSIDDNTIGSDLRYTSTYISIKNFLRNEETSLPVGVWESEFISPNWEKVINLCLDALVKESKDFQLMTWLIEAYFMSHTLEDSVFLWSWLQEMVAKFWKIAYPIDSDLRIKCFITLDKSKIWNKIISQKKELDSVMENQFSNHTTKQQYEGMLVGIQYIQNAIEEINQLTNIFSFKTGSTMLENLRIDIQKKLQDFQQVTIPVANDTHNMIIDENHLELNDNNNTHDNDNDNSNNEYSLELNIQSHEQAYKSLLAISKYLQKNDPHHPSTHMIQKAYEMHEQTLKEIYNQIKSTSVLDFIFSD